jgi:hypothetical protein
MDNVVEILLRFIMQKGKDRTEKGVLISINKFTVMCEVLRLNSFNLAPTGLDR